jgi:hypothetical protein
MQEGKVILAEHPGLGKIFGCSCGAIHVNVGPVTINLEPEAFAQLTVLMNAALEHHVRLSRIKADNSTSADSYANNPNPPTYVH